MLIAPVLSRHYPMNEAQRKIVSHKEGPLLVIAGPGSGKTRSMVLLAMNLLLCVDTPPDGLLLCTYTEKAAYEMQDRITCIARDVGYRGDLSRMKIGTIHSICKQFIGEHLHHTPLGNTYETLDEFTQRLFIFEYLDQICPRTLSIFQERWGTRWAIAENLQYRFDKITEELIFDRLRVAYPRLQKHPSDRDTFLCCLTHAYHNYQRLLADTNCVDFALLEKCAYNLLQKPEIFERIAGSIRYVLVDEYQDTNYIQEQMLISLASATSTRNLCVVGDEDQALYRFRGATVRNILEFSSKFPACKQIHLTTNYRSHPAIIDICNRWIESANWSNPQGASFRTEKTIQAVPTRKYPAYPAVISIQGVDVQAEAEQFAEVVYSLKRRGQIKDYNEVALLLHSVRKEMSDSYMEALAKRDIPAFCPRARAYFDQEEVCLMVACFARIVNYQETAQEDFVDHDGLPEYIRYCTGLLMQQCKTFPALTRELSAIERELLHSTQGRSVQGKQLADYFYRLVFCDPFHSFLTDERKLHNLVRFSELLKTFQNHYQHVDVCLDNLQQVGFDLFHRFFSLLYNDGANQYENPQEPFPTGHVQIMTIHQAKGLEFPVIAVGRLDKLAGTSDNKDRELQAFYHQECFEPVNRIPAFDLRRLYYVAFSRAKRLLILTASKKPRAEFAPIWQQIPQLARVRDQLQSIPEFSEDEGQPPQKPRYSYTNHIQMYEICPRQFQFFQEYNFTPAYTVDTFSGLLVHQTLERIHRLVLEGKLKTLDDEQIRSIFERVYTFLHCRRMYLNDLSEKEKAWFQILNYFHQNYRELGRIEAAELNVQVEKEDYVLTGKIDLLMRGRNGLEVMDFKTGKRPTKNSQHLALYKQQLYLYALAIEKSKQQLPEKLFLYWTGEQRKEDALMEIPCQSEHVKQANRYFDDIAARIKRQEFAVVKPPEPEVCRVCDIRHLCKKQGVI